MLMAEKFIKNDLPSLMKLAKKQQGMDREIKLKNFKIVCKKCGQEAKIEERESVSYRVESHNYDYPVAICKKCDTMEDLI